MNCPQTFIDLIKRLNIKDQDESLKFIGFGNPNAKILIIGKEAAINLDSLDQKEKDEERYKYDITHTQNCKQWAHNINADIQQEDIPEWRENWSNFNPLFPYKWQRPKLIRKLKSGKYNGGTSATWCSYQKLIDFALGNQRSKERVNFFQHAFITELSDNVAKTSPKDKTGKGITEKSINKRCEELLRDKFFRSFPIVIVACGHYVKDYGIDLTDDFDQTFIEPTIKKTYGKTTAWYNIHKKDGRLLIHTRQLSNGVPDALLEDIAKEMRTFL